MTRRNLRVLAVLLLLAVTACAPKAISRAQERSQAGDLEGARTELERERDRQPDSADLRVALGQTYYHIARDALDREHDEARYLAFLEKSIAEFVTALEIDPRHPDPHLYLAIIDTYRGQPRQAMRGLYNYKRLSPGGIAYTNIGELYVYQGELNKAQTWTDLGLKRGAPYGAALFNDMLIAWKRGDLPEARKCFAELKATDPEMLRTINVARLPVAPRQFEDFASYCCSSPACGPYMRDSCKKLALEVRERELSKEAVLKELQIEMERRRRLQKVYEQRKELEIQVDPEATGE